MARIKLYQRNPANRFVGVPPADNSGAIIANAVSSSANLLADQANQQQANDQYMARFMLNQATQDIGQQLRQAQRAEQINAEKQQAFNDAGESQTTLHRFTMQHMDQLEKLKAENVQTPENIPKAYEQWAEDNFSGATASMTPGAAKLATPGMYNVIEANRKSLGEYARDKRTELNTAQADNNITGVVARGRDLGFKGNLDGFGAGLAEIANQASIMAVNTPKEKIEADLQPRYKTYTANVIDGFSEAKPGEIDTALNHPAIKPLLDKYFSPSEIRSMKRTDVQRVNEYMTEESLQDRIVRFDRDMTISDTFGYMDRNFYDPKLTSDQRKESMRGYIINGQKLLNDLDNQVAATKDATPAQKKAFTDYREEISKNLAKAGRHIETLDNAETAKAHADAIKALADQVAAEKVSMAQTWNSEDSQKTRENIEYLWQKGKVFDGMTQAERLAATDANREYIRITTELEQKNPAVLAKPTYDSKGNEVPGDLSNYGTRRGQIRKRLEDLSKKPTSGSNLDRLKQGISAIFSPQEAATDKPPENFYTSAGAYSAPDRAAVDQALESQVNKAVKVMESRGLKVSPEKIREIRRALFDSTNRAWVPKFNSGPPTQIKIPNAKPRKANTKSGLVPPPPPGGMLIEHDETGGSRYVGGRDMM